MNSRHELAKDVTIVIPCHNEEATVGIMVLEIKKLFPSMEIVVVDNNSSDSTATVASSAGAKVFFEERLGKGHAFRRGIGEVNSEVTIVVDGDCTYDLNLIPELIESVRGGIDMAVAKREPLNPDSFPSFHKLGNYFFSRLHSTLFKSNVKDAFSGYRAFSKAFLLSFNGDAKGFEIETDLNLHSVITGSKVSNIPSTYLARVEGSQSKLSTFRDGVIILKRTLFLTWRWRPYLLAMIPTILLLLFSVLLISRPFSEFLTQGYVYRVPSLITGTFFLIVAVVLFLFASNSSRLAKIEMSATRMQFNFYKYLSR